MKTFLILICSLQITLENTSITRDNWINKPHHQSHQWFVLLVRLLRNCDVKWCTILQGTFPFRTQRENCSKNSCLIASNFKSLSSKSLSDILQSHLPFILVYFRASRFKFLLLLQKISSLAIFPLYFCKLKKNL